MRSDEHLDLNFNFYPKKTCKKSHFNESSKKTKPVSQKDTGFVFIIQDFCVVYGKNVSFVQSGAFPF